MTAMRNSGLREHDVVTTRSPYGFAPLFLQCLLLVLVVRLFHIEERRGLLMLLSLAVAGWLLHRALPLRWRPAWFLVVSLFSFPLALAVPQSMISGWADAAVFGLVQSAWVIGLGGVLIGVCHLPLSFAARAILLLSLAATFVWIRSESLAPFWAVFGSIFMFRLWIYARELRRPSGAVSWPVRLSYFFVLSNGFFPFFPILSFRTFTTCYQPGDSGEIAQRGIAWILRGLIHLLCYRAIKTFWLPAPIDLIDARTIGLFLVTNYGLYLQVSGHFHIITGLLHLFGFEMPRTHDRYFLASGFSDIWRRINIYWKDFLNEHVFLPTFFVLHRFPRQAAVVVAVGATFAATWILHSWQAFWLVGHFPLAARDAILWLAAGSLVAISSLRQYRAVARGERDLSPAITVRRALWHSLGVVGTFLTVSAFWACWTVPGFPQLIAATVQSGGAGPFDLAVCGSVLAIVVAVGTAAQLLFARGKARGLPTSFPLERSPAACLAVLTVVALAAVPVSSQLIGPKASRVLTQMTSETPTLAELGREIEGYYEELVAANVQTAPLTNAGPVASPHQVMWSEVSRRRNDLIDSEMIPGWQGTLAGVPFRVNRLGMRDDDVPRRKPPGTHRIAVVGSSATMGFGVPEDADFESIVERRLNETTGPEDLRIELLNFATGGYVALQWAAALREKVFPLDPDAVYYVAHQGELLGSSRHLTMCLEMGYPLPYVCLDEIVRDAGAAGNLSWGTRGLLLEAKSREILACLYRGMVDNCRQRDVVPVYIYLPMPGISQIPESMDELLLAIAREAGFVVIDLSDWAAGRSAETLMMDGHHHPTPEAHQIIAEHLLTALRRQSGLLPTPEATGP